MSLDKMSLGDAYELLQRAWGQRKKFSSSAFSRAQHRWGEDMWDHAPEGSLAAKLIAEIRAEEALGGGSDE